MPTRRNLCHSILEMLASCALLALTDMAAHAQQTSGTPGSPSATTTIDGKYLPPPPPKFGGEINLEAAKSTPYWPPQVVPPKGAPNIPLTMTDDQGYGVSGTFGGGSPRRRWTRSRRWACAIRSF